MEPRISLLTLGVSDLARSKAFYGKIGFKPRRRGMNMLPSSRRVPWRSAPKGAS